jgi:hypothetical protein
MLRAVAILALCALAEAAFAHDPGRPELNGWFDHLASGKGLCCSLSDGLAVADPDWESRAGHYRVRIDDRWIDVPDEAVITEPNLDGRTMVWPLKRDDPGDDPIIRCFMPGPLT